MGQMMESWIIVGQIMESWIIVGQIMGVMDYSGADNGSHGL